MASRKITTSRVSQSKPYTKPEPKPIIPKPVKNPRHGGVTPFPISILKEIVTTCGYDANSIASGPDGKSNHTTVQGLERTAFLVLGSSIMNWQEKIAARESGFNNPQLAEKVYACIRPLLPKDVSWLHSNFIMDALIVYELDPSLEFAVYGPLYCDSVFTEEDLVKEANRYAFVFTNASKEESKTSKFSGSHWTVMYVDILENGEGEIDYYDSTGAKPSGSAKKLIESIVKTLVKKYDHLKTEVNFTSRRKQMKGSHCGVYIVHFTVQRLFGRSFREFNNDYLPDEEIEKYRNVYWTQVDKPEFQY